MDDDDPLWTLLRRATRDPVPDHVLEAARASLSGRDPDSALAALVADSQADADRLVFVRGDDQARLLTFSADDLTFEVEISPGGRAVGLIGQLVPPTSARLAIDHPGGVAEVTADALGRFQASGLTPGPMRLRCTRDDRAGIVRTDWFLV
jgi:hypothetical protein